MEMVMVLGMVVMVMMTVIMETVMMGMMSYW